MGWGRIPRRRLPSFICKPARHSERPRREGAAFVRPRKVDLPLGPQGSGRLPGFICITKGDHSKNPRLHNARLLLGDPRT